MLMPYDAALVFCLENLTDWMELRRRRKLLLCAVAGYELQNWLQTSVALNYNRLVLSCVYLTTSICINTILYPGGQQYTTAFTSTHSTIKRIGKL